MPALSNAEGNAPRPSTPDPRPRRGAPRGNLNALKSGKSSKQLKALVRKLMLDHDARRLLRAFSDRRQLRNRWVEDSVNAYALQLKRQTDRAKRDRTRRGACPRAKRREWLPYGACPRAKRREWLPYGACPERSRRDENEGPF